MDDVHATNEFCMIWQNDQDVYNAVVEYVREMIRRNPGVTDQTIGRNVKDRVFSWAYGGGYGHSEGWGGSSTSLRDEDKYPDWHEGPPPAGWRNTPFSYFLDTHRYGQVDEDRVGEEAREALGNEGYDPDTGDVVDTEEDDE